MATNEQIEASRINGSKSRGPVTAQGKRNSAGNRLLHGALARAIVLDGESTERFQALVKSIEDTFKPQNPVEELLVSKMAAAQWRQWRIWTYERNTITQEAQRRRQTAGNLAPDLLDTQAYNSTPVASITQHEMRFDRQFERAVRQLTKLRNRDLNPTSAGK